MATKKTPAGSEPAQTPAPETTGLTVEVQAMDVKAVRQEEQDAKAEVERLYGLLAEAKANYEENLVDRDVPASVVAEMERELAFINADLEKARRRVTAAERAVRQSFKLGDDTIARWTAELLREKLASAVKGLTLTEGSVVVKPADRVKVSGTRRVGEVEIKISDTEVDPGILKMAVTRALAGHLAGDLVNGAGRDLPHWKATVTKPDEELERQYEERRAEEARQHRIRMGAVTGGYRDSWGGTIGG